MKIKILLIIGALTSCTPAEVQIAETVVHEAEVAEEAVENDLMHPHPCPDFDDCPGHTNMQQGMLTAPGANNARLDPSKSIGSYRKEMKSTKRSYTNRGA